MTLRDLYERETGLKAVQEMNLLEVAKEGLVTDEYVKWLEDKLEEEYSYYDDQRL